MQIVWVNSASKEIRKAPFDIAAKLIEAIGRYSENRHAAIDIKALQGVENTYRIRVRDWRLIFTVEDGKIVVKRVGPRGSIY